MRRFLVFIKSLRNNLQKNEQSSDLQNDEEYWDYLFKMAIEYEEEANCNISIGQVRSELHSIAE